MFKKIIFTMKVIFYIAIAVLSYPILGQDNKEIEKGISHRLNILAIFPCDGGHLSSMAGIINALSKKDHNITALITYECSQKRLDATNLTHSTNKLLVKNWLHFDVNFEIGNFHFMYNLEKLITSQNKIIRDGIKDYLNNEGREEKFDVAIVDLMLVGALIETEVQGLPTVVNSPIGGRAEYYSDRSPLNHNFSLMWHCLVVFMQLCFHNFHAWIRQTMLEENLPGVEFMTGVHPFEFACRFPNIIPGSPSFSISTGSELRHVYIGANRDLENYTPLNQDIKDWLDLESKDIIYISFGTHTIYTEKEIQEFVAFLEGQVSKYRFIWGVTNSLKDVLDRLKIERHSLYYQVYLPQVALLNENLIKIFISHGGANSLFDAIMMEKPVICIPGFGDQPGHCQTFEELKMGILCSSAIEFNKMSAAIDKITENRYVYIRNIKRMKKTFENTGEYDALEEFITTVAMEKWMAQPMTYPLQSLSFDIAYYVIVGFIAIGVFGVQILILWIICYCSTRRKTK